MTDFELTTEKDEYVTFVHGKPVVDLYNIHKLENRILNELRKIQGKIFTAHSETIIGHFPEEEAYLVKYRDFFRYKSSIVIPGNTPFMITKFESNVDYNVSDEFQELNKATKQRYENRICLIKEIQIKFTFLYKDKIGCSVCCPVVFREDSYVLQVGFGFDRLNKNMEGIYSTEEEFVKKMNEQTYDDYQELLIF